MSDKSKSTAARGFSLIEIAIVLVIISVLLAVVVVPLSGQIQQQRASETRKQLEAIREALNGYAVANGRLPCPATDGVLFGSSNSNGVEKPLGGGACDVRVGLLPAATLSISPVDQEGFAIDAWASVKNRIVYAVADTPASGTACPTPINNPLTTINGMKTATMDCLSERVLATICATTPAGAVGGSSGCGATPALTTKAPYVLLSLAQNAPTGGASGSDEAHNLDGKLSASQDLVFVSRTPSSTGALGGEFDDIVTWGSLNTLFARMVQAGKLP